MLKTKYLVYCNEFNEILLSNRADAEEYVLSLTEEEAYDDYVCSIYYRGITTEEYFYEAFDYHEPYKTSYGSALLMVNTEFYITEVEELD